MGMAAILVMCPTSCHLILFSSYEKACIQNLAENGPLVSEKIFEKGGRMDGRRLDGSTISSL